MRKRIAKDPEMAQATRRLVAAIASAARMRQPHEVERLQRELARLNLLHLIDDELRMGVTAEVAAELKARIDGHVMGGRHEKAA